MYRLCLVAVLLACRQVYYWHIQCNVVGKGKLHTVEVENFCMIKVSRMKTLQVFRESELPHCNAPPVFNSLGGHTTPVHGFNCCKALFPLHMVAVSKDSLYSERPNLLNNGPLFVEQRAVKGLRLL